MTLKIVNAHSKPPEIALQISQISQLIHISDANWLSSENPSENGPEIPSQPQIIEMLLHITTYPTKDDLFQAIQEWAEQKHYCFVSIYKTKINRGLRKKIIYGCDRYVTRGKSLCVETWGIVVSFVLGVRRFTSRYNSMGLDF